MLVADGMTPDSTETNDGSVPRLALRVLAGVASFAIVAGLFLYSIVDVLSPGRGTEPPAATASSNARPTFISSYQPSVLDPPVASGFSRLLILMLCDDEIAVDAYPDAIYFRYISLRPSTDENAISLLLAGDEFMFPANAVVVESRCASAAIERGDFP
jgi:hypothetical protein